MFNNINIKDVEKYYVKIHKFIGLPGDIKFLGKGLYGYTFKCGDKTLKITQDERDPAATIKLVNKYHPNVYNIYSVFKINKLSRKYRKDTYGIIYDYIDREDSDEEAEQKVIDIMQYFNGNFTKYWPGAKKFIQLCQEVYYNNDLSDEEKLNIFNNKLYIYAEKPFLDNLQYFAEGPDYEYSPLKHVDQLHSAMVFLRDNVGIKIFDLHSGNIIINKDNVLKVIDLGSYDRNNSILLFEDLGAPVQKSEFQILFEKGILDSQMPDKVLGRGVCGEAFKFGNLVVKITNSCDEAATAFAIIGKKLDNVYNVRHVFKAGSFRYVIIYDYLENINKQQKAFVDSFWDYTANTRVQLIEKWSLNLAKEQLERAKQEIIKEPFSESVKILNYMDEPAYYFIDGFFDTTGNTEKMEEFIDGLLESNELKWFNDLVLGFRSIYELTGYIAGDVHRDNVLQNKDGKLIIIDIGRTDSRQEGIPEIS